MGVLHYLVEDTHVLCINESEHLHSTTTDCSIIYTLENDVHPEPQLPDQNQYQKIKICLTISEYLPSTTVILDQQKELPKLILPENLFSNDIFHPPIS